MYDKLARNQLEQFLCLVLNFSFTGGWPVINCCLEEMLQTGSCGVEGNKVHRFKEMLTPVLQLTRKYKVSQLPSIPDQCSYSTRVSYSNGTNSTLLPSTPCTQWSYDTTFFTSTVMSEVSSFLHTNEINASVCNYGNKPHSVTWLPTVSFYCYSGT